MGLKPCPFCGGAGLDFELSDIDGWIAFVRCVDCDDSRGPMSEFKYQDKDEAKEDAARQWNRRTPEPVNARLLSAAEQAAIRYRSFAEHCREFGWNSFGIEFDRFATELEAIIAEAEKATKDDRKDDTASSSSAS